MNILELQNLNFSIIIAQNREETNLRDVIANFVLFDLQYNASATFGKRFDHL